MLLFFIILIKTGPYHLARQNFPATGKGLFHQEIWKWWTVLLSMPDSILTGTWDFRGLYTNNINRVYYAIKGAVSSGEGRNFITTDEGLAYTGRVEVLPLGKFKSKGDYSMGDLAREEKPKLSVGFTGTLQ